MCFLNQECDGFTLSSDLKCILHRTATALHFTGRRISQVGIRNRTSTFPKYCEEELRRERCKTNQDAKDSSTVQSGKAILYGTGLDIRYDKISLHHK